MSEKLKIALEDVRALPHITLGNIVDCIQQESLVIVCLIAILPFLQPIPIPGLSSVLGFVVLLQGFGLVIWKRPILTHRLKAVNISHERFEMIYKAAMKFEHFTAKVSNFKHPLAVSRASHVLCGISIIISAAFLSLPLPIPFSNFVPALSIFLLCVGLLEEDLALLLMGHGITLAVIWMAVFSYHLISEKFQAWF